jgi:predicted Zn-dependent peptidase
MTYEKIMKDNIEWVSVYTNKFKTVNINISFEQPFETTVTAARSLLARVLRNSSSKYPSKRSMSLKLQDLYDARLGISYNRVGRTSVTSISLTFVNDAYLQLESSLGTDAILFLNQVINHPLLINQTFVASKLDEEKRLLIDEIKSMYNNKSRFALNEMIEAMFATELYGKKIYGTIDQIEKVTVEDLMREYQSLIYGSKISVFVVGDIDQQSFLSLLQQELPLHGNQMKIALIDNETREVSSIKEIIRLDQINQSKLNIGFRTHILVGDPLYHTMLVLGSLLGGHANSRLFEVVREQHSLAYSIGTIYGLNKGVLVVMAGIDSGKYHQVMDLIMQEIKLIQTGMFEESLIELTKLTLNNELLELFDSPSGMVGIIQKELDFMGYFDLNQMISLVNKVTKEDIVEAANTLILDTVYLLTNKEVEAWNK